MDRKPSATHGSAALTVHNLIQRKVIGQGRQPPGMTWQVDMRLKPYYIPVKACPPARACVRAPRFKQKTRPMG